MLPWGGPAALIPFLLFASPVEPLTTGALLPAIGGQSLSEKPVQLPDALPHKPALLVFSFSKQAGGDARLWLDRFLKDPAANQTAVYFNLMVLESVPRLLRGMVSGGIKSGIPAGMHERSIRVYQGEADWKRRLNVTDNQHAYLVVLDSAARVRSLRHSPFDEAAYQEISDELQRLSR